ncbi:MAG TPA: c-type cytochrome [Gammaproteobacteria bacterium]|nr:c-type cytochrome [Gammaproteobacteria bacterium]
MSRYAVPLLLTGLATAACAPAERPRDGAAAAPVAAADFDAGAIRTAAEYLEEPQFAVADLERGERLSLACVACHSLRPGEAHVLGPNLGRLFGSPAAAKPGFGYSAALSATGLTWTPRALDAWLAAPASFVPGTSMVFAGFSAPADRRDLIAYLLHATEAAAP